MHLDFPYQMERLKDGLHVCVTPDHRFGTDAFLLADFAAVKRKETACDLGSGCGIIPFLWAKSDPPKKIYAVELQEKAIRQMHFAVAQNGLEALIEPVAADLRQLPAELKTQSLDVVTCNPPYQAADTGLVNRETSHRLARHEMTCTLEDVCRAAASMLRFGGRLCLCQRPERLTDAMMAMRLAGLEPKRLRFVAKYTAEKPWLFLLEGKKGSKPFLQVLPPLAVYEGEEFSSEMRRIYAWQTEEQGEK